MSHNELILTAEIERLLNEKSPVLVGIDGRCASGKSTLAKAVAEHFDATVFHADDFFLRPEQRTPERLNEAGGNFDRERFEEEILLPSKSQNLIKYCPFDCQTFGLKSAVEVEIGRVVIIEGSYCCHPNLWKYYDLHVFLDVDEQLQKSRITARNGEKAEMFFNRWIPLEERYFNKMQLREKCELRLDGGIV